ncbi:hypothetical protein L1887_42561 [Cichorium endivia]|nr:hypothetical protein L1887_42561 [Cichorium endivia]
MRDASGMIRIEPSGRAKARSPRSFRCEPQPRTCRPSHQIVPWPVARHDVYHLSRTPELFRLSLELLIRAFQRSLARSLHLGGRGSFLDRRSQSHTVPRLSHFRIAFDVPPFLPTYFAIIATVPACTVPQAFERRFLHPLKVPDDVSRLLRPVDMSLADIIGAYRVSESCATFSFYRLANPDHDHDSYVHLLSIPHPAVPGKPLAKVLKPDSETSSIPSRSPLSCFTDRANGEHDCSMAAALGGQAGPSPAESVLLLITDPDACSATFAQCRHSEASRVGAQAAHKFRDGPAGCFALITPEQEPHRSNNQLDPLAHGIFVKHNPQPAQNRPFLASQQRPSTCSSEVFAFKPPPFTEASPPPRWSRPGAAGKRRPN